MKSIYLLLTLLAIVTVSQGFKKHFLQKDKEPNLELVQVVQISRHGERTPVYKIPSLHYSKDQDFSGNLTPEGEVDHFLLGVITREQYFERLGLKDLSYENQELLDEIQFISSKVERCHASSEHQLQGILDAKAKNIKHPQRARSLLKQKLNKRIETVLKKMIQKIKSFKTKRSFFKFIQNTPFDNYVLIPYLNCPNLRTLQDSNLVSRNTQRFSKQLLDSGFLQQYVDVFKMDIKGDLTEEIKITDIQQMYDGVICNRDTGLWVPEGVDDEFLLKLKFVYDYTFLFHFVNNRHVIPIYNYSLMKELISKIRAKVLDQDDAKRFISFVGHESNVNALNVFFGVVSVESDFEKYRQNIREHESCNYGAHINFELYSDKNTQEFYIRYVFDGVAAKICGDSEYCSWNDFLEVSQGRLIKQQQFDEFCFGDSGNPFEADIKENW